LAFAREAGRNREWMIWRPCGIIIRDLRKYYICCGASDGYHNVRRRQNPGEDHVVRLSAGAAGGVDIMAKAESDS